MRGAKAPALERGGEADRRNVWLSNAPLVVLWLPVRRVSRCLLAAGDSALKALSQSAKSEVDLRTDLTFRSVRYEAEREV